MAAATAKGITFEAIIKDVRAGNLKPAYLLMGEENYYIDRIAETVLDKALKKEERDFNLSTYYGPDANVNDIMNAAQSYPMGAEHSVVIVKEAQGLKEIENLTYYLQHPQPTTVLLLIYKNGVADRRKKFVQLIGTIGIVFDSQKVKEAQLPALVRSYAKTKGYAIDEKSVSIICESVGTDLVRLYGELDKLFIAMPVGQKQVTPEVVERNIGLSKDYNFFELQNALIAMDKKKAFQIVKYYEANQKANPIQATLPVLFRLFSSIMMAYYAPEKTSFGIANYLGVNPWQAERNVLPAMKMFSARKVLDILDAIRDADKKSKGFEGSIPPGDILRQLVAFILE